jgi:hypothetical protein
MADLRNLTMHTGDEFALLRNGNQRVIVRGREGKVRIPDQYMGPEWKVSGHTHPSGHFAASDPDKALLRAKNQEYSSVTAMLWGDKGYKFDIYGLIFH